mgnify:CR=1 FL=1
MTDKNQKAMLTHSSIPPVSGGTPRLDVFLCYVHTHLGEDVQGLAFATNGTWTVLGFDKGSSAEKPKLSVTPFDGREFDPTKLFELRLWVPVKLPDEPPEGTVLAHEYRWVNGVGAVELRVTASTDSSQSRGSKGAGGRGWVHAVQYLQHVPSTRSTTKPIPASPENESNQSDGGKGVSHMTTLEFIQEEDKYGNTVVVDQLFTGEWN